MTAASDKTFLVRSEGIFHGLPVLPDELRGQRAMVVGASGQSGQPMIDALDSNPQRWEKVYALSRRSPTTNKTSNVEHVPVDLLWSPERISATLLKHQVQA